MANRYPIRPWKSRNEWRVQKIAGRWRVERRGAFLWKLTAPYIEGFDTQREAFIEAVRLANHPGDHVSVEYGLAR